VGDRTFTRMAETRNYVGDFYEEVTHRVFPTSARHQIDSQADVCPDLSFGERTFLEVKSVGCSRRSLIYSKRLEKDRAFANAKEIDLFYVFWVHEAKMIDCATLFELRKLLARSTSAAYVVPLKRLERWAQEHAPRVLNYRHASLTKAAVDMPGWAVPLADIREMACQQSMASWGCMAYGVHVPSVPMFVDYEWMQRRGR
jgi:hypothetical protein